MRAFTGTFRLVRLALRRDRVRLSIWLVIIIGLIASVPSAVQEMYAEPGMRDQYVATMTDSMMGRLYGGILDGDSLGAVVMVESYAFTATLIACMSAFLLIRHTRANEESSSLEVLQSAQVGRFAPLLAAFIVALLANVIVALATVLTFGLADGYESASAWLLGGAFLGVGMSFAALAATTAQLASTARGAKALVGGVIGGAFVLRGLGDAFAHTVDEQLHSHWLSWLSPLGWGQQMYPFTRQHVWVVGLFAIFVVASLMVALVILRQRDYGAGLLGVRSGAAKASIGLKTYIGFAWRLHRATNISWIIVMLVLGIIYGSMAQEFKEMLDSSEFMKQYIVALGGEGEAVKAFLRAMISITAVVLTGYVASAVLRMQAEEASGRLESLLATATNRTTWMMSHIAVIVSGIAVMLIALGAATALAAGLSTGEEINAVLIDTYLTDSLLFMSPLFICLAAMVGVYGLLPRIAAGFSWGLFLFVLLISQLGALLDIPEWIQKISPFYHIPADSSDGFAFATCFIMLLTSSLVIAAGLVAFRRRDIGG